MKRILIVGTNPSVRSTDQTKAFDQSTKSGRTLRSWLADIDNSVNVIHICNLFDKPTTNNKALNKQQIDEGKSKLDELLATNPYDKVIAVGKTASKVLSGLGYEFYELPHPSGLNRQLNDPEYIKARLEGLRSYLARGR